MWNKNRIPCHYYIGGWASGGLGRRTSKIQATKGGITCYVRHYECRASSSGHSKLQAQIKKQAAVKETGWLGSANADY